jgi:hypothetical protein
VNGKKSKGKSIEEPSFSRFSIKTVFQPNFLQNLLIQLKGSCTKALCKRQKVLMSMFNAGKSLNERSIPM